MSRAILLALAVRLTYAQVSVLTYHNDLARTGQNLAETALTPAAVSSTRFGKLFTQPLDGVVYAQPLYVPGVTIPSRGIHNVVYVATEHDSVYAFDADSTTALSAPLLWRVSFINPSAGVTTVPAANTGCNQIEPELGITGTPVIDPSTGTLYVVAMTLENGSYLQRLHALDIATGAERAGRPVEIHATFPGTGEGGSTLTFNPKNYKERPGLVLLNGVVYTSWSSHCDIGAYHGWIIGYDAVTLAQTSVWNDTPNGNEGSFWASGAAPAVDAAGNIYVISGNGSFDANTGGPDLGESYIRLSTAGGIQPADYFTPFNQASLNAADTDTGSSGALLLPDAAGSAAHPHLLVSAGKEGRIYLIDRDHMGRFQAGSDSQIPQSLPGVIGALFGIPAYFNNTVYFSGAGDNLKAFSIANAQLSGAPTSRSPEQFGYPGSTPVISANGASGGIVWALEQGSGGTLHAYDATDLSKELFSGGTGSYVKFSSPTVVNGHVYAGTQNSLLVYGLTGTAVADTPAAVNGATFQAGAALAPGSIVSLFGSFGVPATKAPHGQNLPTVLTGISVRVNGALAPLFYIGPNQINAQLPYELAAGVWPVVVSVNGADLEAGTVQVQATAPGLFLIGGAHAAVRNQDNSVNSSGNPAAPGTIVSAYLTGQGALATAVADGALAPASPHIGAAGNVTASIDGQPVAVHFAGLSPGSAGLFQVNLAVPQLPAGDHALVITIGDVSSNAAPISVGQ